MQLWQDVCKHVKAGGRPWILDVAGGSKGVWQSLGSYGRAERWIGTELHMGWNWMEWLEWKLFGSYNVKITREPDGKCGNTSGTCWRHARICWKHGDHYWKSRVTTEG